MYVRLYLLAVPLCLGAEPVRLVETLPSSAQVHVKCQVSIEGALNLPGENGKPGKRLATSGTSKIEYDERILKETDNKQVERTIRSYARLDFARKLGAEDQQASLRPEVNRLVILRHRQYEVPFCPSGPLTLEEIELVRTDVFTPALRGLLPEQAVGLGQRWRADLEAVRELTDLDRIDDGGLVCSLDDVSRLLGRRVAKVAFTGTVRGIDKDGNVEHRLDGSLYFDLDSNHISYVTLKGTRLIPGANGQAAGQSDGVFTLTRELRSPSVALSDATLRALVLEPNDDNTRILFDNAALGLRLLYPHHWHIEGTNPRQVGLNDGRGTGLLLVVDPGPPAKGAVERFHQAVQNGLKQQKVQLRRVGNPELLQPGLAVFTIDAIQGGKDVTMVYFVLQQPAATATVTATLLPSNLAELRRDVERIVRSVQLSAAK
jgi:hypothetical protein